MLILLTPLEDVIRLANSSMCHSNAAGQEVKKKNGWPEQAYCVWLARNKVQLGMQVKAFRL